MILTNQQTSSGFDPLQDPAGVSPILADLADGGGPKTNGRATPRPVRRASAVRRAREMKARAAIARAPAPPRTNGEAQRDVGSEPAGMPWSDGPVEVSIIAPVYNEEGNLLPLHDKVVDTLESTHTTFEIIYVDDGSRDRSHEELREIADRDKRASIVRLRRNFGQTAAIAAGVQQATGKYIVFIDADLQNDPADIPRLLEVINQGFDVVSGWRKDRQDSRSRILPSQVANALISVVTGVHLHDYGCTLKAYRAELIHELQLYGEMHRFIPAYLEQLGARIAEIPVTHHPRLHGRSKYGMSRLFRVVLDLLTVKFFGSYHTRPMHFFGSLGLASVALGLLTGALMVWQKWALGVSMIQTPLLLLTALFLLMGVNAIFLGLLGELIMRVYYESQQKRPYQVRSVLNPHMRAPVGWTSVRD